MDMENSLKIHGVCLHYVWKHYTYYIYIYIYVCVSPGMDVDTLLRLPTLELGGEEAR